MMIDTPLPALTIRGKSLLPVIQAGMAVGVSAHRLAGSVAREGAIGTIASVDLGLLHPDLMRRIGRCRSRDTRNACNLEALDREVRAARGLAGSHGLIAVNVIRALKDYAALVRQACESGVDAIVVGAGLPVDLPELTKDFKDVALIPVLGEERGSRALLKCWMAQGRIPDAIIIEDPRFAGGHLGVRDVDQVNEGRFDLKRVLAAIQEVLKQLGLSVEQIPLIPAGGVNSFAKLRELLSAGAGGVQVGTPFAVTTEADAHPNFKKVLVEARAEDVVMFMSNTGLPARAALTPWLKRYLKRESRLRARATPGRARCPRNLDCLTHCGLKDGDPNAGQFCLATQLAAAQRGEINRGLFFRGSEPLPFGREIRPVRELLEYLLTGRGPTASTATVAMH